MSSRIFIVLNPVAGNSDPDKAEAIFAERFQATQVAYEIYQTTGEEDVAAIVEEAAIKGYDLIVAAGGDGTVSQVAGGLACGETPLGILPLGTGNLIAQSLKIPSDIEAACRILTQASRMMELDGMQVGDKTLIPYISLGLYAEVIDQTPVSEKRQYGKLAYLRQALRTLSSRQAWTATIIVDGQPHQLKASMIILANISEMGLADLQWETDIRPDDGIIDICVIRARTVSGYLSLLWRMLNRQPKPASDMIHLRAKNTIDIFARRAIPVRLEGETNSQTALRVKVLPKAVKVVVGPEDGV